jgi:hypothetical protein
METSKTTMTTWKSNVRVGKDTSFEQVGGEVVLLNLESGKYYGLDEVGARMWTLLAQHGALEPVYQALLEEYDVAPERLQHDLLALVDDLVKHGLLETVGP